MALPTPDVSPSGSPAPSTRRSVAEPGPEYDPGHLERPEGIFNDKPSPPFSRVVGLFEVLRDSKPQARKDKLDHWFTVRPFYRNPPPHLLTSSPLSRYGEVTLEMICTLR